MRPVVPPLPESALRIAVVAEGDANTEDCWSGSALRFVTALRDLGHQVDVVDVELKGPARWLGAGLAFRPGRERWRQEFILGATTFHFRSLLARRRVQRQIAPDTDVVLQIGASFTLGLLDHPARRVLYADGNAAMAEKAGPFSEIHRLSERSRASIREREQRVYAGMDRIWSFSGFLGRSFSRDFGVPSDRIVPIFGGANRSELLTVPPREAPPSGKRILFVGKQWRRKGLPVLIEAFARVRQEMPDAELHIVGPGSEFAGPGIVTHGPLRPWVSTEAALLTSLFRNATLFCLPSRYEPFGVAFVEAMLASVPCIGTDQWAMPEIISDGETGLLVQDGDSGALASAIISLLAAPERAYHMGLAGRRRAHEQFTWEATARRADTSLRALLGRTPLTEGK